MKQNYFLVETKFGHVGRNYYIPKFIPIMAPTAKEAAEKARWTPRVKHHDKFAILSVVEINEEEYKYQKQVMNNDPYFSYHSIQEQQPIMDQIIENRIPMNDSEEQYKSKEKSKKKSLNKKNLIREIYDEIIEFEYENEIESDYNFA